MQKEEVGFGRRIKLDYFSSFQVVCVRLIWSEGYLAKSIVVSYVSVKRQMDLVTFQGEVLATG